MGSGPTSDSIPTEKPKVLGLDTSKLSTHEQGRPLPYAAGTFRLAGTFLAEAWNVRSKRIRKKIGKKSETVGYNYYCSFAIVFCHGLVETLDAIYLDDDLLWEGPIIRGANDHYFDITIHSRGTLRFYWGTETQPQDPDLTPDGTTHPAYRGQCYAVFKDWLLGQNRTNVSNVEIQARRYPSVSWLSTSSALELDANPIAVVAEWLESPRFGLGLPVSRINTELLDATAFTLLNEGLGISPVVTGATGFRQLLAQVLDHIDGYLVYDNLGRFGLGLVRGSSGDEPTLDESDLVEPPSIEAVSWWETYNEVYVRFRNRERKFADDSVSWRDRGNYAVVGSTRSMSVSRPWVTRQKVAWMIAAAICRREALPRIEGSMRVKKASAATLDAGSLFHLSYAKSNLSGVLCRVLEKAFSAPESPYVTLRWQEDRGYLNVNLADVDQDPAQTEATYQPAELNGVRAIELPFGYTRSYEPTVALLPARGDALSNGWNAYWETDTDSYEQIGQSDVFVLQGVLQAPFPATVLKEDDFAELDVLFEAPDQTLEGVSYATALARASIRLFVGDEIMLGYTATLVSAGRYRIKVLRAWYGTRREDHAQGATVHVADLGPNPPFTCQLAWRGAPTTESFKCQPFLLQAELDLALTEVASVTVQRRAYCPPPPSNLRVFEDGHCPVYASGLDITVQWDTTSDRRCVSLPAEVLAPSAEQTVLVITTTGGIEMAEITVAGATGPATITNAVLIEALGSETDFVLRAYAERAGYRSLAFDAVTVRKV